MNKEKLSFMGFISIVTETMSSTSKDLATVVKVITIVINALNKKGITFEDESRGIEAQMIASEIISKLS